MDGPKISPEAQRPSIENKPQSPSTESHNRIGKFRSLLDRLRRKKLETDFDKQFSKKEKVQTSIGNVEITDVTPENLTDQMPVLLIGGWGESDRTHTDTIKTINDQKRRAIFVKVPRMGDGEVLYSGKQSQAEIEKAVATLEVLNTKSINKVDVIAHSEGAINALLAAQIEPDKFRNIVLVAPAGLTGKDNIAKLTARFNKMLGKDAVKTILNKDQKRANRLRAAQETIKYLLKNPIKGLEEVSAIAAADIYEELTWLKKQGVGVSIVQGVDDSVFPMQDLLRTAREKGGLDLDGFYSVKGDHREISVHPEKYTALAVNALENLKERYQPKMAEAIPVSTP